MRIALICLLAAGCYHPSIGEGDLFCEDNTHKCPDGFQCVADDVGNFRCYKNPPHFGPYGGGELGALDLTGKQGTLLLYTDTGAIVFIDMSTDMSAMPTMVPLPRPGGMKPQQAGPPATFWSFTTLIVPSGVTVQPSGSGVPVLAATEKLILEGDVDARAAGGLRGVATMPGATGVLGGVGGGGGAASGSGGGGGGGGNLTDGKPGMGAGMGSGGPSLGGKPTDMLFGAGGGGGGPTATGGNGGSGGGTVVLMSPTIDIEGKVWADGAPGDPAGGTNGGGGGGGAGGSILVSGDSIIIGSNAQITALGGMGGTTATPPGTGGAGGAGGAGRIHFAGPVSGATSKVMPMPTSESAALAAFPPQ